MIMTMKVNFIFTQRSINGVNRRNQVSLVNDSLVTNCIWSHLYESKIKSDSLMTLLSVYERKKSFIWPVFAMYI